MNKKSLLGDLLLHETSLLVPRVGLELGARNKIFEVWRNHKRCLQL